MSLLIPEKFLDGKVGMISSYDTIKCYYIVQVSNNNHRNSISSTELFLSPENMEPFSWTTIATHTSSAACDSCQVNIKNHFASSFPHASPSVTFWSCVFSEIGGHSQSPHTEGENQRSKLMSMLEKKERIADSEAKKVRDHQLEFEKGFSKMCSTRQPAQNRPRTITRQKPKKLNPSLNLQIKSFWKQKSSMLLQKLDRNKILLGTEKMMSICLLFHSRQWTILCIHVVQISKNATIMQKTMMFLILFMDRIILHLA